MINRAVTAVTRAILFQHYITSSFIAPYEHIHPGIVKTKYDISVTVGL